MKLAISGFKINKHILIYIDFFGLKDFADFAKYFADGNSVIQSEVLFEIKALDFIEN